MDDGLGNPAPTGSVPDEKIGKLTDYYLILLIVKPKNKETFSVSPGRFGFAAYTPKCDLHSNRTDTECPINSKLYYKERTCP